MKPSKIIQSILIALICLGSIHVLSAYQKKQEATSLKKVLPHKWYLINAPEAMSFSLLNDHEMRIAYYCQVIHAKFSLQRHGPNMLKIKDLTYTTSGFKCPNATNMISPELFKKYAFLTIGSNKLHFQDAQGNTKIFVKK